MTEKVLHYDASVVPQETGYWCGPATTQVVLNSLGLIVPESVLASEIGTTTNGTDYVGLIERVLDRRVPDAQYTSVYLEQDPPSQLQKDLLWERLTRSINAGYGVPTNWDSPVTNHPVAIKGSQSPNYGSREVFHYVPAMGYDDNYDGLGSRAVWIADPGFRPFGYWITFNQYASLIPPKGYCYANVNSPVIAPTPIQTPPVAILSKAMGDSVSLERYAQLLPYVADALKKSDCITVNRIAMWCAQIGHESVGLKYMRELWGPTADQLTYQGRMGNDQPGDGYRYLGRGPIQVTGKDNYRNLSKWAFSEGYVPTATYFVDNPTQLEQDEYAFLGAIWYWTVAQSTLNTLSDNGDVSRASKAINRGNPNAALEANGIADRTNRWVTCKAIGIPLLSLVNYEAEEGFLMSLSDKQQQEIYDKIMAYPSNPAIGGKWSSRAIFRDDNNGVDDTAGMMLNTDGSVWDILVIVGALAGVSEHVARIQRLADGQGPNGSVEKLVTLAKELLQFIQKDEAK